MVKQVQKRSSKDLKLYIIKSIFESNKLPDGISKSRCNYHTKPFLKEGLIEKRGYGVWCLTKKGETLLNTKQLQKLSLDTLVVPGGLSKSKKQIIRGHGFMWKLKFPEKAHCDLDYRKRLLKRNKRDYIELNNKNLKISIRDHKVHLGLRAAIVYFNPDISYYGKSALDSYKEALLEFNKVIKVIEGIYSKSLRIRDLYKFKVCKNHYGDLNNEFAIHYKNKGKFVRVYDNGKEWLVMDFSDKKFIEAETTSSDRAKYDMDNVISPTMNTLRDDPGIIKRLDEENRILKESLRTLQESVKFLMDREGRSINREKFIY